MKTLIFDYHLTPTGHSIPYCKSIAFAAASEPASEVTVCLSDAVVNSSQFESYFGTRPGNISVGSFPAEKKSTAILHYTAAYQHLCKCIRNHAPDVVLIPTADRLATIIAMRNLLPWSAAGKTPIHILLMKGKPANSKRRVSTYARLLEWKLVTNSSSFDRMLHLDPLVWEQHRDLFDLCPDPVPTSTLSKPEARQLLNLPADIQIVSSIGNQNFKKGSDLLIDAFLEDPPPNTRLLLAGPQSDEMLPILEKIKHPGNDQVIIRNDFLSEDEFQAAIIASDVIGVPYRVNGRPSGIMTRAIAWGIPVVGIDEGWIKWAIAKFDCGKTTDVHCKKTFNEALKMSLRQSGSFSQSEAAGEFAEFNTEENFQECWLKGIRNLSRKHPARAQGHESRVTKQI